MLNNNTMIQQFIHVNLGNSKGTNSYRRNDSLFALHIK